MASVARCAASRGDAVSVVMFKGPDAADLRRWLAANAEKAPPETNADDQEQQGALHAVPVLHGMTDRDPSWMADPEDRDAAAHACCPSEWHVTQRH